MRTFRNRKTQRIRFDGKPRLSLGRYNVSFLRTPHHAHGNHHYTISYGYAKKEIDLHLTWEKSRKHHSILKLSEEVLIRLLDRMSENIYSQMKPALLNMNVSPGIERFGFFENIIPNDKKLKQIIREYGDVFVQKLKGDINLITDEREIDQLALGLGKYRHLYSLTNQFVRYGYPMRLWNFKTAVVSYSSLNLLIVSYDKAKRRMLCLDLNKVDREDLIMRALGDTIGPERLSEIEKAIKTAPDSTEHLPPDVPSPQFTRIE